MHQYPTNGGGVGVLMRTFASSPTAFDAIDAKIEALRLPMLDAQQKAINNLQKLTATASVEKRTGPTANTTQIRGLSLVPIGIIHYVLHPPLSTLPALDAATPKTFEAGAENRLRHALSLCWPRRRGTRRHLANINHRVGGRMKRRAKAGSSTSRSGR